MALQTSSSSDSDSFALSSSFPSSLGTDLENSIIFDDEKITKIVSNNFIIASLNAQSLRKNFKNLKIINDSLKFDIITITETWNPSIPLVKLEGYHDLILKTRARGRGGGVGIYLKSNLSFSLNKDFNNLKLKTLEIIACDVQIMHKNITIVSVYRIPNSKIPESINDITVLFDQIKDKAIVVTGDLNIDTNSQNSLTNKYLDLLQKFHLRQSVLTDTRITSNSHTCIDHVISNRIITSLVTHHSIGDHQLILSSIGPLKCKEKQQKATVRKQIHYKNTLEKISQTNWDEWISKNENLDIDLIYNSFNKLIQDSICYAPLHKNKKRPKMPWFDNQALDQKNILDKARKKFLKHPNEINESLFRIEKRIYNGLLITKKNEYFQKLLKRAGNNSGDLWKVIKQAIKGKKDKDKIWKIWIDGNEVSDQQIIANSFSSFFKNQAFNLTKNLVTEADLSHIPSNENTFSFKEITKSETYKILKSIKPKNSTGPAGIPAKLINKGANLLKEPMQVLINQSLKQGKFADNLKKSKLIPIFKSGELIRSNFRPINQIPTISKVIEKGALAQVSDFMEKNYPDDSQFGFKSNHSTLHAMLTIRNLIEKNINKGLYTLIISCDLSKAFDCICSNKILIEKLKRYGFDENSRNFYKSFFSERTHYCEWNDHKSTEIKLHNISIIQGSNSGPSFFNYYLQDLSKISNFTKVNFADDTILLLSNKKIKDLEKEGNIEFSKVVNYFKANKLILNTDKTNFMIIKPPRKAYKEKIRIKVHDMEISETNNIKYLGVIFDNKLNFQNHFKYIETKLMSTINMLICSRQIFNYKAKMLIYNSKFRPYIDYCSLVFMDKLTGTQLQKLQKLQKKALRLIFNTRFNSHTRDLYIISKVTPIENLYKHEAIKFIHKFQEGKLPNMINTTLKQNSDRILRATQETTLKYPPGLKKGDAFYNIIYEWNKTIEHNRNCGSLYSLKKALSNQISDELVACTINNCYMCTRDKNRNYLEYSLQ